jgi:hypothetical protein
MNRLPDDILNLIYQYKHQLEYNDTLEELLQIRINCRYLFSLNFVRKAKYLSYKNILKPCLDINNINVDSYEILNVIRKKCI